MINRRLILLRKNIRENKKVIIDTILENHESNICIFCGSKDNLTKEHVLPKWAFGNCSEKYFTTELNGLNQKYSRTTVPACFNCNSNILGYLEYFLEQEFMNIDLKSEFFNESTIEKIIIWLEIIEYKFQILNLRRKFIKTKEGNFIPFLAKLPLSIMQADESTSPSKVFSNVRNALHRISIKSKTRKSNSLVIFETKNKGFHFFNKLNDFLFVELPEHAIALFYFYNQEFKTAKKSHNKAMEIIKKAY